MKEFKFILLLLLMSSVLIGQNKYIYEYSIELNPGLSKFNIQNENIESKSDSSTVYFKIVDKVDEPISGVHIGIKNTNIKEIETNSDGYAYAILPNKPYTFVVSHMGFTDLEIPNVKLKSNSKVNIGIALGLQNSLRSAVIRSKRKLSKREIKKITDDLSNEEDNPLITNKICIISWTI